MSAVVKEWQPIGEPIPDQPKRVAIEVELNERDIRAVEKLLNGAKVSKVATLVVTLEAQPK